MAGRRFAVALAVMDEAWRSSGARPVGRAAIRLRGAAAGYRRGAGGMGSFGPGRPPARDHRRYFSQALTENAVP